MIEKKLIIAGSREFSDYRLLKSEMKKINFFGLKCGYEFSVISGNARGADRLGVRYASEHGLKYRLFNAPWQAYGKKAGIIRNIEMAKQADFCLIFWDGKSSGTKHMIKVAKRYNLVTRVITYLDSF